VSEPGDLPHYVVWVFTFTTLAAIELFARATPTPARVRSILYAWLILQGGIAAIGFYRDNLTLPPPVGLALLPPLLTIGALFATTGGRAWLSRCDLRMLTWMHTVRVPVELTLFWLFQAALVPQLMTFEGVNFDILSGLTAPLAALVGFAAGRPRRGLLVAWNLVCLGLLLNIVSRAILSVETPFQQFAFDQPNVGVLLFPFIWLPSLIVPLVLLAHVLTLLRAFGATEGKRDLF
jgi:hypothetical protein